VSKLVGCSAGQAERPCGRVLGSSERMLGWNYESAEIAEIADRRRSAVTAT
jgi:hypothetical protein